MTINKEGFLTAVGVFFSTLASFFGGWDNGLITLIIFMCIDYISGIVVAGVFKKSPKTETGTLQSMVGFNGLCKKGVVLLIVLVATRIDLLMNTTFVRDATVIAFVVNEAISIIENAGLMGIPIPKQIIKAIDLLKKSGGNDDD